MIDVGSGKLDLRTVIVITSLLTKFHWLETVKRPFNPRVNLPTSLPHTAVASLLPLLYCKFSSEVANAVCPKHTDSYVPVRCSIFGPFVLFQ